MCTGQTHKWHPPRTILSFRPVISGCVDSNTQEMKSGKCRATFITLIASGCGLLGVGGRGGWAHSPVLQHSQLESLKQWE